MPNLLASETAMRIDSWEGISRQVEVLPGGSF
jgi:hypothetical protein